MNKVLTIFSLLIFSCVFFNNAYASDFFAVDKGADGVVIIRYNANGPYSLEDELRFRNLDGYPIKRISPSDLPSDKQDRKYWKVNDVPIGKKIIVDETKKQADIDEKEQKKTERENVRKKICNSCTDEEWEKFLGSL